MSGGLLVAAAGAAFMVGALPTGNTALVIATTTVIAAALGPLFTLSINLVVASAPVAETGSATAVGDVGGGLGNALNLAFLGSLSAVVYRCALQGTDLSEVPDTAFTTAVQSGYGIAALLLVPTGASSSAMDPSERRCSRAVPRTKPSTVSTTCIRCRSDNPVPSNTRNAESNQAIMFGPAPETRNRSSMTQGWRT